jgi:hypothetical protein
METTKRVNINEIIVTGGNPRTHFPDDEQKSLKESIQHNGLLQPLVLNKCGDEYRLVAGGAGSKHLSHLLQMVKNVLKAWIALSCPTRPMSKWR